MDDRIWLQREVRVLFEITEAVSGSLSQQEMLAAILERLVRGLGYKAATLRLLDEERRTLELKTAYGLSEAYLQKGAVAVANSQIDQVVLTGQRMTIADVGHDPGFQYAEAAAREGLASALVVPLELRDRVIGVVRVYTAETHLYEAFQTIARHLTASLDLREV
jgi:GAF domain-containing protein